MKILKLIVFCATLFISHNVNSQIHFSELDETIDKLLPKAKKNKLNEKQLALFTSSYHQANENDHKRIMELRKSGQPDIWPEIYFRINGINYRQEKIKTLPDDIKTAMGFKPLNLDNEIKTAKEKAELYIYAKSNLLLNDPTEENLNEAKRLIDSLSIINPQSNNLDVLALKFVIITSKQIIFRVATPTELYLPDNFAQLVLDFEDSDIYNIPFDIVPNENTEYDLMIRIMIEEKSISPERIDAVTFEEKKDNLVAKVTDKTMIKSATIKGQIEYIDVKSRNILLNTPFDIASTFVYNYAEISGDTEACSNKTIELSNKQIIDFPCDNALLKDTARKLNLVLKSLYQKK